jgi:hypothetical protein
LVNAYLADRRLKRVGEVLTTRLPELPTESPMPEMRMPVPDALASLRRGGGQWWYCVTGEDLSVEQAAAMVSRAGPLIGQMSRRS